MTMGQNPNAIESEPSFCYLRHADDVCAVHRRLFIMSPVHACATAEQVGLAFEAWRQRVKRNMRQEHPIFFFVKDHKNPVPDAFWPELERMGAILIRIDILDDSTLERTAERSPE
jgi:hypothetical protein